MVANKAATQQKQLLEQKSKWSLKLGELLDFDASDIIQLTIQLDSAREARQYLNSLLDPADRAHTDFVNSYVEDMFGESSSNKADTRQEGQEVIGKRGKKKKGIVPAESSSHSSTYTKPYLNKRAGKTSRKTAGLQSLEQLSSLLHGQLEKGRIKCDCMTGKHALVGNCLACGNIVCAQEGVGVCLSCGEDQVKILDNAMATDADAEQLGITRTARKKNLFKLKQEEEGMDPEKIVALMKAMELKERLLVFDRQMAKRTKVIDDEDDYYELDSRWLDPKTRKAREALKSQLDEAKLELKKKQRTNIITLDIMNQRVVDARDTVTLDESQYRPPPQQSVTAPKNAQDLIWNDPDPYQYANPGLTTPPKYIRDDQSKAGKALHTKPRPALPKLRETYMRVQGEGFVPPPLKDNPGKCMSMHQPWASLLVQGIKTVEGRGWYSNHRGRLWIASTVKEPTPEEIEAVESQYRSMYGERDLPFPETYPQSCLLGCVSVVDVLTQDEYKEKFSESATQESVSEYVFVCEEPQELALKYAVTGDHKIWNLDKTIATAANAAIERTSPAIK